MSADEKTRKEAYLWAGARLQAAINCEFLGDTPLKRAAVKISDALLFAAAVPPVAGSIEEAVVEAALAMPREGEEKMPRLVKCDGSCAGDDLGDCSHLVKAGFDDIKEGK